MTAQTMERARSFDRWTYHRFPLLVGKKAWKHAALGFDGAGNVAPMGNGGTYFIGLAAETVDATAAAAGINVNLGTEIEIEYFASAGGITAADVGKLAYFVDDQTVTTTAATNPLAGRIWDYSATLGVGVQKLIYASVPAGLAATAAPAAPAAAQGKDR